MKSLSILSLVLAFALTACDAGLGSSETVAAPSGSTPACADGACPMSGMQSQSGVAADAVKSAPGECSMCPSAVSECEASPECDMDPAQCDMDPAECQEKMEKCNKEQCPKAGN